MLTRAESIVSYEKGVAVPDRLTTKTHAAYKELARQCLHVYATGLGRTRRELHRAVEKIFAAEADCPSRRIQAFYKLLDDASQFKGDPHGNAAELRLSVFSLAAASHPLVRTRDRLFGSDEMEVKERIARELGRPWVEIEAQLYADVIDFQPLVTFGGYASPEAFLRHYNMAQVQACLYRAERMCVQAREDFKPILRYARLADLMFDIRCKGNAEYLIELSGPATLLRETHRYGVNLARFIPALLACKGWELEAIVQTPWHGKATFALSSRDGLRSHWPQAPAFDSSVEENFAAKFGEYNKGWKLLREATILHAGQATFVPDFTFRHDDGTEVLFEIVGFWTPEYLEKKRGTLRRFARHRILLALPAKSLRGEPGENVIVYKSMLKIEPVLAALERARVNKA